jgi:hypothetical protein
MFVAWNFASLASGYSVSELAESCSQTQDGETKVNTRHTNKSQENGQADPNITSHIYSQGKLKQTIYLFLL